MLLVKTMTLRVLASTAILSLFACPVNAALMSVDDPLFGVGSMTVDSSTNLAWLDLSITEGKSFNEVSSQLGVGSIYSGYRFASPDEVYALFVEAQIPDINHGDPQYSSSVMASSSIANAAPAMALIQLMGPSYTYGVTLSEIAGFSSQHVTVNGSNLVQMPFATVREGVVTQEGIQSFGEVYTTGSYLSPADSYVGVGSWLVRPVPEPAAVTMFFAGLVMLFIVVGYKRAKHLAIPAPRELRS